MSERISFSSEFIVKTQDPLTEVLEFLNERAEEFLGLKERGLSFEDLINFVNQFFAKWGHCINFRNGRFVGDGIKHIIFALTRFSQREATDSFADLESELLSRLTRNDTFYFRDVRALSAAVDFLKGSRDEVSIASWPCSTGEEPKTIATLCHLNGLPSHICGFDLVPQNIEKARDSLNLGINYALSFLSDVSRWKNEGDQRRFLKRMVEDRYSSPEERKALYGIIQKIHFDAMDVLSTSDVDNDESFDFIASLNFLRCGYLPSASAVIFMRRMWQRLRVNGILLVDQVMFDEVNKLHIDYSQAIQEMNRLFERVGYPFLGSEYVFLQKKK